ncbi:MAG: amino acid ABC transporter permease [Candidatus Zixiibacteriota bacterium]|nr:MAG: amino acid ABC transporter permease [candidate division Zixibacteria bacterium]HHI02353.1 amino acid ABC transporter permease [candidate division Zixibacteria bacterium]
MLDWLAEQIILHWDILKYLIPAIPVTVLITVCSFSLAMILGLIIGVMRISRIKLISNFASIYINVIRGIPLLVQIFFIYFGLGKFLNLDRLAAGILAVGICYSAYLAEIFRSGIDAIARGQHEAAKALGMTRFQTLRYVIIPQSLRIVIPPIANEFIASLKDSSLVSIIGMREITRAGREYYSQYFVDFQTWMMVALIYLAMTLTLSKVVKYLERLYAVKGFGSRAT